MSEVEEASAQFTPGKIIFEVEYEGDVWTFNVHQGRLSLKLNMKGMCGHLMMSLKYYWRPKNMKN